MGTRLSVQPNTWSVLSRLGNRIPPSQSDNSLTKKRHRRRVRRGLDRPQRAGRRLRRSASPHRRRRRASRRRYRVGDRAKYRCSHSRWRRKSCVGPKSLSTGAKIAHRHERLLTHVPAERIEVMSESVAVVSAYLPSALSSPKWRSTGGRPKKKSRGSVEDTGSTRHGRGAETRSRA